MYLYIIFQHLKLYLPSDGQKQVSAPSELGSAQGFFLLVRESFLATGRPRLALRESQAWVLCKAAL